MKNPFSLAFGKEPEAAVSRTYQLQKIKDVFIEGDTGSQAFIITGVRGSGKTVLLSEAGKEFDTLDDWTVVDLNANNDMLASLLSKLNSVKTIKNILSGINLSISLPGVNISYGKGNSITDPEIALEKILKALKKKDHKLLVTIDEVDKSEHLKSFITTFQMMLRKNLPLYILMTGLYENVSDLQNESNMTFLLRTPKVELTTLNKTGMISSYMKSCNVGENKAREMAGLTKGYAFAFQLLGYLFWNQMKESGSEELNTLLPEFDQNLEEFVYAKIWSSLSATDKKYLRQLSEKDIYKVSDLLTEMNVTNSRFSIYRKRLAAKGLINTEERGYVSLSLPRFEVFIKNMEII